MKGQAHKLMSFSDVADTLNCTLEDVRRWVMEDRTLKAVRVDPNGHKVEFTIGNLHTIDVGVDGAVTNCVDGSSLGNLRVEYDEVARFLLIYSREVGRTLDAEGRSAKLDNATRKHNGSKNSGDGEAWEEQAREMALAIVKRQKARDLYPNQVEIADEIAAKFRTNGVVGIAGKPLTGAYIKRHALKGISSAKGKQLSTTIRRGK